MSYPYAHAEIGVSEGPLSNSIHVFLLSASVLKMCFCCNLLLADLIITHWLLLQRWLFQFLYGHNLGNSKPPNGFSTSVNGPTMRKTSEATVVSTRRYCQPKLPKGWWIVCL